MARSWSSTFIILLIATGCIFVVDVQAQAPQQAQWLAAHNAARRAEGAGLPPLTWSTSAYQFALEWAQKQAALPGCPFDHSGGPYGENLSWSSNAAGATPANVVRGWMEEKPDWDFASRTCTAGNGMCGHYTQVVWKTTTSVGCASVLVPGWTCGNFEGGKFSICNYSPPGNLLDTNPY